MPIPMNKGSILFPSINCDTLMRHTADSFYRTYIFTLDSLGWRHDQTVSTLAEYLRMEVKCKQHVNAVGEIQGKLVLVYASSLSLLSSTLIFDIGACPEK